MDIPYNLHGITKELFRMAVCLKPRLIQSGLQGIDNIKNSPSASSFNPALDPDIINFTGTLIFKFFPYIVERIM